MRFIMINKRSKNVSKFIRCRAVWEFFSQTGCDLDNESFQSGQVKLEQRKLDLEKRYLDALNLQMLIKIYMDDHDI